MARSPRLLLSSSYYHIITRANNRTQIFKSQQDYQYYISLIIRFKQELPFDLFHYCLMPNHIHLLVRTRQADHFSLFMKKINLAYFYYFKKQENWVGHIWQDRFRSQPVGKDAYFIQCGKYIELNPVRAKLVRQPEDYPYSSFNYYVKSDKNPIVTEDIFYQTLGENQFERQKNYQNLVIDELIVSNYSNEIWGSKKQMNNEKRKISHINKDIKLPLKRDLSP